MPYSVFGQAEESQEIASDLIDVLLLKLKKLTEMRRLMQQELKAIEGDNSELLQLVLNQRQALMEQIAAIDLDYQHLKQLIARRVYLDDLDFATLLSQLPPEPADYLRKANNDLLSITRVLAKLSDGIQELLAKRQIRASAYPAGKATDWIEHPVYQYYFAFTAGESRLRKGRRGRG